MPGKKKTARGSALDLLAELKRKAAALQNAWRTPSTVWISLPPVTAVSPHDGKEHTYAQSETRKRRPEEYPENSVESLRRLYWDAVALRNLAISLMEVADQRLIELKKEQA